MNAFVLVLAMLGAAVDPPASNLDELVKIRESIEMIESLEARGVTVDRFEKNKLMLKANAIDPRIESMNTLIDLTGGENRKPPNAWNKITGFFTFVNVALVLGALLIVVAVVALFGIYFAALLEHIPLALWEIIAYAASFGLIAWGSYLPEEFRLYPVIPGCMLLWAATGLTRFIHPAVGGMSVERFCEATSVFLTLAWSAVAIFYGSDVVGFMAVGALLATLGFFAGHIPGVVFLGFQDDAVVFRTTVAAFALLAIHVGLQLTGTLYQPIEVFRDGMASLGTFVYFLGILIMSSKWYGYTYSSLIGNGVRFNWAYYLIMQVVVIVSGIAAMYLGTVHHIGCLAGIGGTFFCLYLLEKYAEIRWEKQWAWGLLGLGLLLYGFSVVATNNPQYFLFH